MKRFIFLILFLFLTMPSNSWAQTATANAGAGATANVNNAPKTESSVVIDNHSKTKIRNVNRQFLPLGSIPPAGTMQLFLPPREFGAIPNFEGVYLGIWRKAPDSPFAEKKLVILKDRPLKLHRYIYDLPPMRKVIVIVGKNPLMGASPVGEVDGMAHYREDSRSLQMFSIDTLAKWGANVVLVVVNGPWFESWSKGSNKGISGSSSQLATAMEKVVFGENVGFSSQKTRGGVIPYPVIQTIGYRMEERAWRKLISPPLPPSSKTTQKDSHDGKKWLFIKKPAKKF